MREIKSWYKKVYPTDTEGDYISKDATFEGLMELLQSGHGDEVYDYMGGGDSLIRERVFQELSNISGDSYDDIYEAWLNNKGNELYVF